MSVSSPLPESTARTRFGRSPHERARHLEALYRLLERMYRADSLSDIHIAAVEATRSALDSDGIALLLGDGERGLRCAAALGLSAACCAAAGACVPELRLARGLDPLCLCGAESGVDATLTQAMRDDGMDTFCLVPLVVDGMRLGELVITYHGRRALEAAELEVAAAIARHLALAIERQTAQDRLRDSEDRLRRELLARKRAEDALRENEHRLGFALEAGHMGTWEWNVASGRMAWSSSLERIHGLKPGGFPGTFSFYRSDMHPEDREAVLASLHRAVVRNVEHHMEYRIVWADGSIHWVEARGKLFQAEEGEPARMIGVCMDITERKRVEERIAALGDDLRRRVEELDALLEVLPVGVLVAHDPGCRHMSMNPAAAALLGLPLHVNPSRTADGAERLPFRVLRDGREIAPEDMPLQRAARTGRPVLGEVLEVGRDDGSTQFEYITAVPLFDDDGRVRGALGAMVDMTERKRFEDALRATDRRKDEFLATLAHELRNPLAPIRNAIEVLRRGRDAGIDPRVPQEVIERQTRHMTRLLDDLLDVSRISYNKLVLRRERIELSTPVQSAIETSRPLIEERGHRFLVSMPEEPLYLDADPVRLAQVFSNLLNNAARYTPPGGRIEFRGVCSEGELCVSVRDDGPGISPETMSQIFGMFSRGNGSAERAEGGLGVGLSLVRALTEMHGGRVEARSEGLNRGSEFLVRLPLAAGTEAAAAAAPKADAPRGAIAASPLRVLVVDDLRDSADSLATLLELTGHEAWTAYEGIASIETAERERPDVILLDIGMPDVDGYEVCRRLRALPWAAGTTLIALTGWGQESDRRRGVEAGFDHHLVKPVEIPALMKLLEGISKRKG